MVDDQDFLDEATRDILDVVKDKLKTKNRAQTNTDERRMVALEVFEDTLTDAKYPMLIFYQLIIQWFDEPFQHTHDPSPVIAGFYDWIDQTSGRNSLKSRVFSDLSSAQRLTVLDVFIGFKPQFKFDIFDIFCLKDEPTEKMAQADRIRIYLSKGDIFRAADVINHLKLQDQFKFDEVMVPLLFANPSDAEVIKYVSGNDRLIYEMFTWLDELTPFRLSELTSQHSRLSSNGRKSDASRLSTKPRGKLIESLAKDLNLPLEKVAPKLSLSKDVGDLRYWVKELKKGNVDRQNWRDVMDKKLEGREHLNVHFMDFLLKEGEGKEAGYWCDKLQLDKNQLTPEWQAKLEVVNKYASPVSTSAFDDVNMVYHRLSLDASKIQFVDNERAFQEMCIQLQSQYLLAMDCEFTIATAMDSKVALWQIASREQIFLIDMLSLSPESGHSELWTTFINTVIKNPPRIILGYDFKNDLNTLANTSVIFSNLKDCFKDVLLDVKVFSDRLFSEGIVNLTRGSKERGLSGLAERTLGAKLDKKEQISDWTKRPLKSSQIIYAALDAFCLLEVYDSLYEAVAENEKLLKQFDNIDQYLRKHSNKLPKPSSKKKDRSDQANLEEGTSVDVEIAPGSGTFIDPPQLKVVCDNMLEGLCKKLRMIGVDAITLTSRDHWEKCGVIAEAENRIILTRKGHQRDLSNFVPPGHCYALKSDRPTDQVDEVVKEFRVKQSNEYVFSRCMLCNGDDFSQISQQEMRDIRKDPNLNVQWKIQDIHATVIENNQVFYGCKQCGKIYWEGSHWLRARRTDE